MAITTNKALLFLAGGCAAALAIAYASGALDSMFAEPPKPIVALPEPAETTPKDARVPVVETPAAPSPAPEAPLETAAPLTEEAAVVPPSFDVMRVEGDGSIVIAGKATPDSKVEILVGSNVIAQATTGHEGDFAAVLEEPMKPGDYQIVLRSTSPQNVVAMSVETAVVSIPETADGQVLALVEEPGKPSEMIILPKPKAPSDDTAVAAPGAAEPTVEEPAIAPSGAEAPAVETPGGAETTEDQLQAALPPPAAPAETPAAPVAPATPGTEDPRVMVEAVEIDGRKIFVAGAADAGRRVRGYANEILLGDATTSPDGRYLIEAERDLPVGDYIIRVDALEADGVKVAARAAVPFEREPGETIAAIAPQAPAAPTVVAPAQPVAVAPAAPAQATTVATDAVEAPPAAAPAQLAQAPADEAPDAPTAPATMSDQASGDTAPIVSAAPGTTQAPAAPTEAPAKPAVVAEAPAAAAIEAPSTATEAAKPETTTTDAATAPLAEAPAAGADTSAKAPAPETPAKAPEMAAEAPASETPAAPDEASAAATEAPALPVIEAPAADLAEAEQQPGTEVAMAPTPGDDLAAPPDAGVPEVLAPKLQSVDSAVIIRRGDTLWRLSYRVYGRGVRYSTIYLANQSQIEDPDRIWPGQVFKLPEKSNDGKADADLGRLGDRATTVPK